METTIRTDTDANCIADLAAAHKFGESPQHHAARLGAPGWIECNNGRTVTVHGANGAMGARLLDCWHLDICDSGGPIESYDLDARGLVPVRRRGV